MSKELNVNKSAQEMFEELGYSLEDSPNNYWHSSQPFILKSYIVKGLVHSERDRIRFYSDETYDVTCNINEDLHKAIIQQIKELWWF